MHIFVYKKSQYFHYDCLILSNKFVDQVDPAVQIEDFNLKVSDYFQFTIIFGDQHSQVCVRLYTQAGEC